jgi:flagellar hook-associated protein 3 FlgL
VSSIRVNPNPLPDLLSALGDVQQQVDTATEQLASGRRINRPSDDPAGAAVVAGILDQSSRVDSFQQSSGTILGQLQTADSTLSSVVTALQRAITLGVQGANGTLSDADRQAVRDELTGIQQQLISLANTSYQGRFIFAGTANTQPYVADSTVASGVRYDGNDSTNQAQIGDQYRLQANLPGSQLFSSPSADVFQGITDLSNALTSNSGIDIAVANVRRTFDFLTSQRVFYGNAISQIQAQQTSLNNEKVSLSSQENAVAGADPAAVISSLVQDQTARQSTLEAIGRVPQFSLFDFLK